MPTKKFKENPSLGYWVNRQRTQYNRLKEQKHSAVTETRIAALEKIGFVWKAHQSSQSYKWSSEQFQNLVEFKRMHGHFNIRQKFKENTSLASWVNTQRTQYRLKKEGRRSYLTNDRIAALEGIGFVWNAKSSPSKGPIHFESENRFRDYQPETSTDTSPNSSNLKKRKPEIDAPIRDNKSPLKMQRSYKPSEASSSSQDEPNGTIGKKRGQTYHE